VVEQLSHDADNLPLSGTEVKNEWSYTCVFPHAFMAYKGTTVLYLYSGVSKSQVPGHVDD
jgi:hypothetical protein